MILAGLFCGAVQAQPSPGFDGKWLAKFTSPRGDPREAVLIIGGSAGTWEQQIQARNNPCGGREVPIAVAAASDTDLEVKILNSKALVGCSDGTISAKRIDDRKLEGTFEDGRKVTLVRP
jgi:hypothetical protein